jgi:16S rRNA (cytosine967-C5)-methyltransferase
VPSPARRHALAVLNQLETRGGTLADTLAREESAEGLDTRERAFLHELVLGSLRRRGWLDHVLGGLSARPLGRTSPTIRNVLRLGAHQLLFLRVPPHAAVSEAVALARREDSRAAGFVNAVLRRLQREGAPAEPDPAADPLAWLTTAGSLPRWLAQRWCSRLGADAAVARARALLEVPPTGFRLNPRVADAEDRARSAGVEWRSTRVPGALELVDGHLGGLADEGVVYVQDVGSQLVARLLARAGTSGRVLDACAAPGGKALLLGDVLRESSGRVFAAEAALRRLGTLSRLRERWGAANVFPLGADARQPPFATLFDGALVDAPCSGLGTLARHPDIRWSLRREDLPRQSRRQREILEAIASLVRPGGRLVYSTCSVEDEENGEVVGPFLEAHPEWTLEKLPDWASPFATGGFVRMDPSVDRGDTFFAAVLARAR